MNTINKTAGRTKLKSVIIKRRKQVLEYRADGRRTVTEATWAMGNRGGKMTSDPRTRVCFGGEAILKFHLEN